MTYRRLSVAPIVCTAGFVETHAMILGGERQSRMREAAKRYEEWLVAATEDGNGQIAQASKLYAETLQKLQQPVSLQCYEYIRHVPNLDCPGTGNNSVSISCLTGARRRLCAGSLDPAIAKMVREMIEKGVLPFDERPVELSMEYESVSPLQSETRCVENNQPPIDRKTRQPSARGCGDEAFSQAALPEKNEMNSLSVHKSRELEAAGLKLVSLRALKHAADQGLSFFRRVLKPAGQEGPPAQ